MTEDKVTRSQRGCAELWTRLSLERVEGGTPEGPWAGSGKDDRIGLYSPLSHSRPGLYPHRLPFFLSVLSFRGGVVGTGVCGTNPLSTPLPFTRTDPGVVRW